VATNLALLKRLNATTQKAACSERVAGLLHQRIKRNKQLTAAEQSRLNKKLSELTLEGQKLRSRQLDLSRTIRRSYRKTSSVHPAVVSRQMSEAVLQLAFLDVLGWMEDLNDERARSLNVQLQQLAHSLQRLAEMDHTSADLEHAARSSQRLATELIDP